jgi:hypothetical protein
MMKTVVVTRASSGIGFSVSEGVVQGHYRERTTELNTPRLGLEHMV